ncbi:unnamed protein product [Blepharisma stoltei]|uniref:C2H2-type domain-containing protein n=1 Tax=Blepharisma stoltei TaxID=1481888 RepID=A0AAU9K8A0_9CILI|nr:unnamed protein product [Blepharisma stoltei]
MDLKYIVNRSTSSLRKLDELGCDLESLFFIAKDLFSIVDDLGLTSKQASEFFFRIKNAYNSSQGKQVDSDLTTYENHNTSPSRLSIENKSTGKTIFFRLVAEQPSAEKIATLFKCESCEDEQPIKRVDIKSHIVSKHDGLN